jgi:hypothetical protein
MLSSIRLECRCKAPLYRGDPSSSAASYKWLNIVYSGAATAVPNLTSCSVISGCFANSFAKVWRKSCHFKKDRRRMKEKMILKTYARPQRDRVIVYVLLSTGGAVNLNLDQVEPSFLRSCGKLEATRLSGFAGKEKRKERSTYRPMHGALVRMASGSSGGNNIK